MTLTRTKYISVRKTCIIYGRQFADAYLHCRLNAPWGTEDNPVEVTSSLHERIVGVPDPYDDSIIWWGTVEEGQPPKQIVETGEFFVLKRVSESDGHGGHTIV